MVSNFFGTPCISRCLWFQQRLQPDREFFLVTSFFITHLQCRARLWWTLLTQTWKEFHLMPILWNKHCSPVGFGTATLTPWIWFWFHRRNSELSLEGEPCHLVLQAAEGGRGGLQTNQRSLPVTLCGLRGRGRWRASVVHSSLHSHDLLFGVFALIGQERTCHFTALP